MLKEFAWRTFEFTGDIENYMFFKEVEGNGEALNESIKTKDEVAISNI